MVRILHGDSSVRLEENRPDQAFSQSKILRLCFYCQDALCLKIHCSACFSTDNVVVGVTNEVSWDLNPSDAVRNKIFEEAEKLLPSLKVRCIYSMYRKITAVSTNSERETAKSFFQLSPFSS